MAREFRRTRGSLLRLVRRRPLSIVVGSILIIPAIWMYFSGTAWWADGLSLVLGATGAALVWTGISGARPDWID